MELTHIKSNFDPLRSDELETADQELYFLEIFDDFLSSSKNLQLITAELKLKDFCSDALSFRELINNITKLKVETYGENLTVLKEATEDLEKDILLIDKFKEVIGAYLKPVEIRKKESFGRLIVEVTGKSVVVSEIIQQLETNLSGDSKLEEVHLVADIIHIDADLENEVWHGKNVVILTKAIKIHDKVTWDVSGKDNTHTYSTNAGTGEDGHGKQGQDGYPGESGGNVLILADRIEDSELLTVVSNGGKGSTGQDGGKGKDGEDGKGITRSECVEKFPPVADFGPPSLRREKVLKQILENINEHSSRERTVWYTCSGNTTIGTIIAHLEHCIKTPLIIFDENIFIEVVTSEGNEITFSFERGFLFTRRQTFFLYKGSYGQPGGRGGEWGLGGQGGYPGEIIIKTKNRHQIMTSTKQGEEGGKGQGGLYGQHGKNGWDTGYLDYSCWSKPKFRDGGKYNVAYYDRDNNPSDRIWCPYKTLYAGIIDANIEQKKCEERRNTRQNNDRQNHARAVKKKSISQSSILAHYSHHFTSTEKSILLNLQSDIESAKQQAVQAINENKEKQEKQNTIALKIKRFSPYQKIKRYYNKSVTATSSTTYKGASNVKSLLGKIQKVPSLLFDNWYQLKNIELSVYQLNQLFSSLEILEDSQPEIGNSNSITDIQSIKKLLINKYRRATLQEIANRLPLNQKITDNVELTPERALRYLIEANENDSNISHAILGTLNQYFCQDNKQLREQVVKFTKEGLQNTEHEYLKRSIRAFVSELGKLDEAHTDIKRYYTEYEKFAENKKRSLNIFFGEFKSELSKPRHSEVFDLWVATSKDETLKSKLEEQIQKDYFLKVLYNRFNNHLKLEYNWDKCYKDKGILKMYDEYIQEKGPSSGSYRELLANIFDTNLRLYAENEDGKMFLKSDHNPSSKLVLHMLCRDNKFTQLNIDKNYFKLEEEHKERDRLYAQILAEIKSFKQKQEFDDYVANKAFLAINSHSEDEEYFNEKEIIREITEYFSEGERQRLKERLEKITYRYIEHQGILLHILQCFSSEGRRVSSQELYCLVNSIISSVIEDKKELNIFCWIFAAHPQKSWMDELTILQLENYFKKMLTEKPEWRKYLSKIENKDILLLINLKLGQENSSNPISTQCIEDTLRLLSNIPNETVSLEGLELSEWPYALKEKFWTRKLSKLVDWQKGDLQTASYYILSIDNTFGNQLAETFIEYLEKRKQELSPDTLTNILSNFHHEKWNLSNNEIKMLSKCRSIDEWKNQMQMKFNADEKDRGVTQLVGLIKDNANTSKRISDSLIKIENSIISIYKGKYVIAGKSVGSFTEDDIKKFQSTFDTGQQDVEIKMLAVIDRAIHIKRGFQLRDTQKLAILALLTNGVSTLAQVSTGEGKSLIVVSASIMKALCGGKVDIVTSSSVLAKRDAESNEDIYNLFNINVSHNCSENVEKRKEAYSGNQVVYGDLSSYQRDYLLDKFYGRNIFGDRNFENVVVDEVDSMLLDRGNNMLYLSHDIAGMDKLESVYIYIWQWINRPAIDREQLSYAFDSKAIKEAVISDLYGLVKKEDVGKLGSELSENQKSMIWERMIKAEILDNQGKLLIENIDNNKLNEVLSTEFSSYKYRLNYLLKECFEREKFIHVPNHLRSFIELHLESWINSAIAAFFMKESEDYVVDVDKTGTSPDRNPIIIILDRNTGTDEVNSQWGEALHQFLQLKHGCKLSLQSLKAVFISNVSFFKLYSKLYGLTGTLGSQRERDLLREIYEVDFVTIPTAKTKQFQEYKPFLCTSKDEWLSTIHKEAKKLTEDTKRSVLIICETVSAVEALKAIYNDAKHVHTYTRDFEEFDIAQGVKKLDQGQIIIATNLAGRGTDIKLTEGLKKAGGLHVLLTYLPSNIRIEQQAFGRAARSGEKGSGQLIITQTC